MSILVAHFSWVCCSKSTSRMTSYSSSVSRIGSVFSHPLGQNVSTCGTPQIRRHRGGLGMGAFLPLCSVYSDNSTLSRKKQFFQKLLHFPSSYVYWLIFGVKDYVLVSNNQSAILLEWCKKAVENKLHRPKCLDLEF